MKSLESFVNPEAYRQAYERPGIDMPTEQDPDIMQATANAAADLLRSLMKEA